MCARGKGTLPSLVGWIHTLRRWRGGRECQTKFWKPSLVLTAASLFPGSDPSQSLSPSLILALIMDLLVVLTASQVSPWGPRKDTESSVELRIQGESERVNRGLRPECAREALLQGCGGAAGAGVSVGSVGLRRPDAAADGSAGAGRRVTCRWEAGQRSRPEGRPSWAGDPVASCGTERWPSSEPSPRLFPPSSQPLWGPHHLSRGLTSPLPPFCIWVFTRWPEWSCTQSL